MQVSVELMCIKNKLHSYTRMSPLHTSCHIKMFATHGEKKMCQSRWWLRYQSVSSWFKVKAACNNNRFFLAWWPCWCWQRNGKSQMRRALARTCLCIFYRENRVFWAIYQILRKSAWNYWYQYQDFGVMV